MAPQSGQKPSEYLYFHFHLHTAATHSTTHCSHSNILSIPFSKIEQRNRNINKCTEFGRFDASRNDRQYLEFDSTERDDNEMTTTKNHDRKESELEVELYTDLSKHKLIDLA